MLASSLSIALGSVTIGLAVRAARRAAPLRRLTASAAATSGLGSPLPRAPEHGDCVYLDYQATTPVWPEVAEAAAPYLQLHWGNPSSGHAFGRPCAANPDLAHAHTQAPCCATAFAGSRASSLTSRRSSWRLSSGRGTRRSLGIGSSWRRTYL